MGPKVVARLRMALLASLALSGCSSYRTITREEIVAATPPARLANFDRKDGQAVVGYVTHDGQEHRFSGRARLEGDTLIFRAERTAIGPMRGRVERVALADVRSVRTRHSSPGTTIGVIAAITLTGVLIAAAVAAHQPRHPYLGP